MSLESGAKDTEGSSTESVVSSVTEELEHLFFSQAADVKSPEAEFVLRNCVKNKSEEKGPKMTMPRGVLSKITELSEELELFGISKLASIQLADEDELIQILQTVINATYDMIFLYRQALGHVHELEAVLKRTTDDNRALKSANNHLKEDVAGRRVSLMKVEEELRQAEEKSKKACTDLRVKTDEVRQLRCQIKYMEKKNAHDLRRKDQEINKLQSQLNNYLGLKRAIQNKNSSIGKDASPQKELSGRETKEMYQQIICTFEASNKGLLQENLTMSRAFQKLNEDLGLLATRFSLLMHVESVEKNANIREEEAAQSVQKLQQQPSWEECLKSSNKCIATLNALADSFGDRHT